MRRLLVALVAIAGVVACETSGPTESANPADAGNYVLRTLNDTVLPYTYVNTSTLTILITADTIFMGVDGSFTDRTHYQRTASGVVDFPVDTTSGIWTEQGSTVTFDGSDGSVLTGQLQAGGLIFSGGGLLAAYTKS